MTGTQLSAREAVPKLLEQLLDLAAKIDGGRRSPFLREIEDRTDEIATLIGAHAEFLDDDKPIPLPADFANCRLTGKQRQILAILSRRPGHFYSRLTIFDELYPLTPAPKEKIIDVFLCKVRRAIGSTPWCIITKRDRGFKLAPRGELAKVARTTFTEWRGVLMGSKQARIVRVLHERLGAVVPIDELVLLTGELSIEDLYSRMPGLRRHVAKTPYVIDTIFRGGVPTPFHSYDTIPYGGYRMRLRDVQFAQT